LIKGEKLQNKAPSVLKTVEFLEFQCAQSLPPSPAPTLTPHQKKVFETILPHIEQSSFQPFLLFGSRERKNGNLSSLLVEKTVAADKGALILVPGMPSDTDGSVFPAKVRLTLAIWHTGCRGGTLDQWSESRVGKRDVVLGVPLTISCHSRDSATSLWKKNMTHPTSRTTGSAITPGMQHT
jgi:primosomal protein N'